jgi:membrane-bound lytic murein transglycosylase B
MARPVGVLIDPYTRAAAVCRGLDPMILVAIHDVETNRDARGATSIAGAVGPMQFLPDTWAAYGLDGDGDGHADVWNLNDALAGATHLLCTNGVTHSATRESAIWNYNHSQSYVRRVVDRIAQLHGTAS